MEIVFLQEVGTPAESDGAINPGAPHHVELTVKNVGNLPITNLLATIKMPLTNSYFDAVFTVDSSHPLLPGETITGLFKINPWEAIQYDVLYCIGLRVTVRQENLEYAVYTNIKE